jgi:ribonuclease P protein component
MYTFNKNERLCSKKLIDLLFAEGKSFLSHPYRISFLETELNTEYPCQVVFIVSKKRYKRANQRNKTKRLMREAYRLNKPEFYDNLSKKNKHIILSVNYVAPEIHSYKDIEQKMVKALSKLQLFINEKDNNSDTDNPNKDL